MLDEFEARMRAARSMGGEAKLAKRPGYNARERIEELLDPGSFSELGTLAGGAPAGGDDSVPADGFPAGFGRIAGRPVLIGVEDFTVMGGSIGLAAADKRYRLTQLALQERVPLVFILEGAGHRMTNALKGHSRTPNDLQGLVDLAGRVPTVCLVMGASAGHGALAAPLMDFVVMLDRASLFTAGPPLVEAATGEKISKEELGGPQVHVRTSGVAHNRAGNEDAVLEMARRYLRYLPQSAWQAPPEGCEDDAGERRLDGLLELIPPDSRRPYKMMRVLETLVDADSLFEIQPEFGTTVITALAFLGGRSVAIVANNPMVKAGSLDSDGANKVVHFIEVMSSYHLPHVFLADNPGVMAGSAAEKEGALRAAARMFVAQRRLQVPKIHVTLRKAFGFGSSVMAMNPFDGQTLSLAFPGATLGAMPALGGGTASKAGDVLQAELDAHETGGPYRVASQMGFDEIIDPRELRNALLRGLELSAGRNAGPHAPVARVGPLP